MTKSKRTIRDRDIINSHKIIGKLYRDYIDGSLDDRLFLYRAQVVSIDHIGGQLQSQPVINPKNSIKARILSLDRYKTDDQLTVFWPLFPFDVMPVKEGEHIYVIFEDLENEHGLWISRIPEPNNVNKLNLTLGSSKYEQNSFNELNEGVALQQNVLDVDFDPPPVSQSQEFTAEETPDYISRVGDRIVHGSNNTMLCLGRDRVTDVNSGETSQAGTIDIVSGRQGNNNDFNHDKSRILISSKTNADQNFNIQAGQQAQQSATIVIKSNQIRILAREGTKIVNEGGEIVIQTPGDITIEGANINIGLNASDHAVLGEKLKDFITQLVSMIKVGSSVIPTSMGPTQFTNSTLFDVNIDPLKTLFDAVLSATVKVKP